MAKRKGVVAGLLISASLLVGCFFIFSNLDVKSNNAIDSTPGEGIVVEDGDDSTGAKINARAIKFKQLGDVFTLNVTISPSNATNQNLVWTTTDASKVAISPDGNTCKLTRVSDFKDEVVIRATSVANTAVYAECSVTCYNAILEIGDYYLTNLGQEPIGDDTYVPTEYPGITSDVKAIEFNVRSSLINDDYELDDVESILNQLNSQAAGKHISFEHFYLNDPTNYQNEYVSGRAIGYRVFASEEFESCDFSIKLNTMDESFNFTLSRYIDVESLEMNNSQVIL